MRYPETKMHAHWIPPEVTERAEGEWELFDAASCDKCVEVVVIDAVELAELRAKNERLESVSQKDAAILEAMASIAVEHNINSAVICERADEIDRLRKAEHVATVVNNNQPGRLVIVEMARKFETLSVGTKLYSGPELRAKTEEQAVPSDEELFSFAATEEFLLFCDKEEFLQIAKEVLLVFGRKAAPPAQALPVAVVHDSRYTHEDGVVKQTVRVLLNPLPEGAELYWGQPAQAVSVPFDIEEYLSAYEWRAEDGGLSELTTRDRQLLQDFANGLPLYTALPAQAVSVPAGVNPFASIWDDCELRKPAMWGCLNQVFTTEEAAKEYQLSKFRGGTGPSVIAFDIAPLATFMIINTSEGMKVNFYGVGNFQEPNHTVITDRGFLNRLGVPFDTGSSQIKQVDYAAVLGALHDELSRVASLHALFDAELQSVESYKHEQTARVERIIKIIRLKLTSGNDVQVSRIHLDRDEAELVISTLAAATPLEQPK